jgi:hypothetical protein
MIHYGNLTNGIWVENKGDINNKKNYAFYSTAILFVPLLICIWIHAITIK